MSGDAFKDLMALRERMDQLFEQSMQASERQIGQAESEVPPVWRPRVDICETDDEVVIRADLPGVARDNIEILVEDNVLVLSGDRRIEPERSVPHRLERLSGPFRRRFALPSRVDPNSVQAAYEEGVLTVRASKRSASVTRKIEIS